MQVAGSNIFSYIQSSVLIVRFIALLIPLCDSVQKVTGTAVPEDTNTQFDSWAEHRRTPWGGTGKPLRKMTDVTFHCLVMFWLSRDSFGSLS